MSVGQVIGVVGPSGVGKDSVMAGLAAADPSWHIARRVITRAPGLGGEVYEPVDQADFDRRAAQGAFCLSWSAHGLSYGIPVASVLDARAGQKILVNLSRAVLAPAHMVFPSFVVLRLSARPETLAARLAGRGREAPNDISARMGRDGAQVPPDLDILDISNDGPLDDTVAAALSALAALRPVRA